MLRLRFGKKIPQLSNSHLSFFLSPSINMYSNVHRLTLNHFQPDHYLLFVCITLAQNRIWNQMDPLLRLTMLSVCVCLVPSAFQLNNDNNNSSNNATHTKYCLHEQKSCRKETAYFHWFYLFLSFVGVRRYGRLWLCLYGIIVWEKEHGASGNNGHTNA